MGRQNETKELCLKTDVPFLIALRGHASPKQELDKSEVCRFDENIGGFCVALFSLEMDDLLAGRLDAAAASHDEDTSRVERKTQQNWKAFQGFWRRDEKESQGQAVDW